MSADRSQISDGHHTFAELYEHRYLLFLALCRRCYESDGAVYEVWISKLHDDGTMFDDSFVMGLSGPPEFGVVDEIRYHLPLRLWDLAAMFADVLGRAPKWDSATPKDTLARLMEEWLK